MNTKKGDFVEITYVGRLEDGSIFDLNDTEIAKKEGIKAHIHDKTIICLGEKEVVPGLDNFLIDKEVGKKLETEVSPEEAFGKRNANLFQMIPMKKFKEQNIRPVPGLQLNIDNMQGVIKSVSGGRVMVDFNHPLAGKKLYYEVTINRKVEKINEQIEGFLSNTLHLHDLKVTEKDGEIIVKAPIPQQLQPMIEQAIKKRVDTVKSVKFEK